MLKTRWTTCHGYSWWYRRLSLWSCGHSASFLNLFNGIDNGGVMSAAEFFTDVCHWECCKLSWNINCNVSGIADVCTSVVFRTDSLGSNAESTGNFLDNALYGNLRRSIVIKNVWNNLLNRRNCNFLLIYEVFAFNFLTVPSSWRILALILEAMYSQTSLKGRDREALPFF